MSTLKIGLAAVSHQPTVDQALAKIKDILQQCQHEGVDIVCFPESYIPGLRGTHVELPPPDQAEMNRALAAIQQMCSAYNTTAIAGLEWVTDDGLQNRAYVVSSSGDVLGYQTKNQITPGGESEHYVPDGTRTMFEIKGIPFGISICHEGWRYPETVRWAAVRGAQIVFQPQWTGSDKVGTALTSWGTHFFEKAMECRAQENSIYFASVNVAMKYQTSATSLIDPKGRLLGWIPYGQEGLLVRELDMTQATRHLAKRYNPALYAER